LFLASVASENGDAAIAEPEGKANALFVCG